MLCSCPQVAHTSRRALGQGNSHSSFRVEGHDRGATQPVFSRWTVPMCPWPRRRELKKHLLCSLMWPAWLSVGYEVKLCDPRCRRLPEREGHGPAHLCLLERERASAPAPARPSSEELCGERCFRAPPSPGIFPAFPCIPAQLPLFSLGNKCVCSLTLTSPSSLGLPPSAPPCLFHEGAGTPSPSGIMVLCKVLSANVSISFLE